MRPAESAGCGDKVMATRRTYNGAVNEGEIDMIYTPNGCIYNDGGILMRCHDFTPRGFDPMWHRWQYFKQYTDTVKHRKAMRHGGDTC
jgi:hypothetical protein